MSHDYQKLEALRASGEITEEQFKQYSAGVKPESLIDTSKKEMTFIPVYVSKAGKNLSSMFYYTIGYISFIFLLLCLGAVAFMTDSYGSNKGVVDLIRLASLVGALVYTILLLAQLYKAGKNLQNACSITVKHGNKKISVYEMRNHNLTSVKKVFMVDSYCPGCSNQLEPNELECKECGLNLA